MTFMIPALQSADTFPQAKACAPRRCGGGKVSAGGYRGSPFRFGWLCLGVSVALFCRAVGSHGAVFTCKAIIKKHSKDFGGSLEDPDVIKLCGCSRNSYYKYKKELKMYSPHLDSSIHH